MPPESVSDELEKWQDARGSGRRVSGRRGAEEQKGKESLAERVACFVEPVV